MDCSHYLRWLNDPVVGQYSEQRHLDHTQSSQYEYLSSFHNSRDHFWDVVFDGSPVGTANAYIDAPNKRADIGIMIGEKQHWGRGFACEAWEAICDYLFDTGIRKIEGGCMKSNHAINKVFKKLGFDQEGIIPGHFLLRDKLEDMVLYGKVRSAKVIPLKIPQWSEAGNPDTP
jgi:RimJ/RimL family protein N-acetyltransferase